MGQERDHPSIEAEAVVIYWDIDIAGHPKCNPQSAQGPAVLQAASIRNTPWRKMQHRCHCGGGLAFPWSASAITKRPAHRRKPSCTD
eukprot:15440609-Alexandrium_andersonii.AAC.1